MRKQKKHFNAFTLVELIIVISILAILATIAFMSFQNYSKDARDGNRVAVITQIDKWLNLSQIKTGNYPLPDGTISTGSLKIWTEEVVYSHMWIIDENISRLIKMNKTPLDPVSESNYVYAVNDKKDTYQIATVLENLGANRKLPILSQTYANDGYKAKVIWNHEVNIKIPKGSKVWFMTVPSMIFNSEWSNILNADSTYHIVDGGQNLPYKTKENSITKKQTGNEVMRHIRKTQEAKIITVEITDIVNAKDTTKRKQKIEEIFWTWNTQESKELLSSIWAITGINGVPDTQILTQTVESIITGGSVSSAQKIYNSCSFSWQTIQHSGKIRAYKVENIDKFDTENTCLNNSQERVCSDGILSWSWEYQYMDCVKWEINNCSASGSYVYNNHTYSTPAINHGSWITSSILSSNVLENNGTFKYTLTSVTCNDGVLANPSENPTPTLQSCNEWFWADENECKQSQNGSCNNSVALWCSIWSAINDNWENSCGTTRTWSCSGLYGGNESTQCSFINPICQSNPTNLSLLHSTRTKTFTFSWTAWNWNWWSCKLQYNKNGTWTNISETTYNCDTTLSNISVTLPWDWWYSGNWNWVQVRIIRTSDNIVLWDPFTQTLNCSTTSWSTTSTPNTDEDCNGSWDNSTTNNVWWCPSWQVCESAQSHPWDSYYACYRNWGIPTYSCRVSIRTNSNYNCCNDATCRYKDVYTSSSLSNCSYLQSLYY